MDEVIAPCAPKTANLSQEHPSHSSEGILLGVETSIPKPVAQAFKETGTIHIIAISGFNMAIVAGLFMLVFGGFLGPRKRALAAATGLSLYTPVVSAAPAVVWATIMGGFALFARNDPVVSRNPSIILGDLTEIPQKLKFPVYCCGNFLIQFIRNHQSPVPHKSLSLADLLSLHKPPLARRFPNKICPLSIVAIFDTM